MSGARRCAAAFSAAALSLVAGVGLLGCSGEPGPATAASTEAAVESSEPPEPTQLARHRQIQLMNEPASGVASLDLDAQAGLVHVTVAFTVVAPDGRRTAGYDFDPHPRALEGREPLQLGVGHSQEEASVMYEVAPDAGSLWADVMAGRAGLAFTRVDGTPEERLSGW